jgi:hypothetical protein
MIRILNPGTSFMKKRVRRLLFNVTYLEFLEDFAEIEIRIASLRDFEQSEKSNP